jgi:battenin
MLPMPGSPSFSWPMFRQRMQAYFDGVDWNVAIAFWLFGNGELMSAS